MKKVISFILSAVMLVATMVVPANAAPATQSSRASFTAEMLSPQVKEIINTVIENIVNEAKTGTSDSQQVIDAINALPVYEKGEERPHHQEIRVSPLRKYFNKALNTLINSTFEKGTIQSFLNHLTSGMYDMYVYLMPIEGQENVYFICCDYVRDDGEVEVVFTGIRYDKSTGKLYGKDNNGLMGIGFDYDAKNYTVTTPQNVWMRTFGYSVLYDIIGNLGFMDTDTVRVKFEHGGKYWMFQFWKGNYGFGLMNGAEVGIYNKTDKNAFMYDCATDDEMLNMSIKLTNGDNVLIEREEMLHWWMCGFRFSPGINPEDLTLQSTIEFEDEGMLNAFLESAKTFSDEMTVTTDGLKVTILWK